MGCMYARGRYVLPLPSSRRSLCLAIPFPSICTVSVPVVPLLDVSPTFSCPYIVPLLRAFSLLFSAGTHFSCPLVSALRASSPPSWSPFLARSLLCITFSSLAYGGHRFSCSQYLNLTIYKSELEAGEILEHTMVLPNYQIGLALAGSYGYPSHTVIHFDTN